MISYFIISGIVGIMLFFTVVVAPTVFKVLPAEWSGKYVRSFFPKYYASLGALTIISALIIQNTQSQYLLILCVVIFAFLLFYLTDRINKAKDDGKLKQFHWLHGLSVLLNSIQLGAFIFILTTA